VSQLLPSFNLCASSEDQSGIHPAHAVPAHRAASRRAKLALYGTVLDGEVVALDEEGRPSFNALQNHGPGLPLHYFIFDLLLLRGRDVMAETLTKRRALIEKHVLPALAEPPPPRCNRLRRPLHIFLRLVAKRRDSKYACLRSGAWQKMRVNRGQDFVIAGYTPSLKNFDALIIGYHEGDKLLYAARGRNRFPPASRTELSKRIRPLEIKDCPFANLPEKHAGRWGAGLTVAKMAERRWLKPEPVGQFGFVEGTGENHLRHTKFIGVRDDKKASEVGGGGPNAVWPCNCWPKDAMSAPRVIRLLVVEDSPGYQYLVTEAFRDRGEKIQWELTVAQDGEEALALLFDEENNNLPLPDLILLDWNLPRVTGSEVLRRLKQDRLLRRIPILVFSTSEEDADVHAAYDNHANGYITKPGTSEALAAIVETIERFWIAVAQLPKVERGGRYPPQQW